MITRRGEPMANSCATIKRRERKITTRCVEIGAFTLATFAACGVPHEIAITGQHRADMERLSADLQTICEYQIRFFDPQGRAPMDRYVFLVMAIGEGYGGLEHRADLFARRSAAHRWPAGR